MDVPSRASRRLVLRAGVAAAMGLAAGRVPLVRAADALPLIKKPIPSSKEMLPVVGLGTNNFDVEIGRASCRERV